MTKPVVCGYATLSDTRIYYEVYGQGAPVLLLHGNGEDLHAFDDMIPALEKRCRVYALDTRGHGKSARGTQPLDFATLAADSLTVMDQLGIDRAAVVGYSDGGNTALHMALQAPARLTGMVLLGANLHPGGIEPRYGTPIRFGHFVCSLIARVDKRAVGNRDILALMVRHPHLTAEQLAGLRVPTLVIAGERDIVKRSHTEEIADAIPGAELEIVPGENHFGLVKSLWIRKRIEQFLQSGCLCTED